MKTLKQTIAESLNEGGKSLADMQKQANEIKKDYQEKKTAYSKDKTDAKEAAMLAAEEKLRRVANAIRKKRADEAK